jgi:hypothetical protein
MLKVRGKNWRKTLKRKLGKDENKEIGGEPRVTRGSSRNQRHGKVKHYIVHIPSKENM